MDFVNHFGVFRTIRLITMSRPASPAADPAPAEKIILEISLADLPEQTQRDLTAHSTLGRCTKADLLARLLQKKFGPLFTVRAA